MRQVPLASVLLAVVLFGCQGGAEYVPPLRTVGDGVPQDLPSLGGNFAAIRLVVNG